MVATRTKDVDPQHLEFFPYYRRHGQDRFLHEQLFPDKKRGVFVDVGAYDGIESSNTLFFEESLEWQGVCVEPLPIPFSRLMRNRNCLCINKCASDTFGKAEFLHVIPHTAFCSPAGEKSSNYEKLSGLKAFYSQGHKNLIDRKLAEVGGQKETVEVECVPINEILSKASSSHIDLLSIDTPGSEGHILQAIDLSRFTIDVIVVEVLEENGGLCRCMQQNGYDLIKKIGYDWIYKKS